MSIGKFLVKSYQFENFLRNRGYVLMLFSLSIIKCYSQHLTDSTKHLLRISDNHYGPFHEIIKDTSRQSVSTFGHYISFGLGETKNDNLKGLNRLFSYSIAYKSHLLSFTFCDNKHLAYNSAQPYYKANYIGLLIGESIRYKYLFCSISVGGAYSTIFISDPKLITYNNTSGYSQTNNLSQNAITIPVEIKLFFHIKNGAGIGAHFSENILAPSKYSSYYIGLSIVTGYWNKLKKKN